MSFPLNWEYSNFNFISLKRKKIKIYLLTANRKQYFPQNVLEFSDKIN